MTHKKLYPFSWMSLTNLTVSTAGACGAAQAHATKKANAICGVISRALMQTSFWCDEAHRCLIKSLVMLKR
jgi:hypothetical protein